MNIRALVEGQSVILPLEDEEWQNLQRRLRAREVQVTLPCCNGLGYMRVSPLGTQHFVHHNDVGCGPESEIHALAKMEIVSACKDLHLEAIPEFVGDGWRADVLVRHPKWQCCFEVQVSPQSFQETLRRQQVYQDSALRCCWLFTDLPQRQALSRDQLPLLSQRATPMFQFRELGQGGRSRFSVEVNGVGRPLRQFVADLLTKRLRYSRSNLVGGITAKVRLWKTFCPSCGFAMHFFHVDDLQGKTQCGAQISLEHNRYSLLYPESYTPFLEFYLRGVPPEIREFLHLETQDGMPFREFTCTGCGRTRLAERPTDLSNLKSMTCLGFIAGSEGLVEIPVNHWCDSPHCAPADPSSPCEIQDVLSRPDLRWKCHGAYNFRRTIDYKQKLPYRQYAAYASLS